MTDATEAICLSCNAPNQLSQDVLDSLSKAGTILCSVCEETVRLRLDPENESEAKSVVVTLSLGAAIVAVVAFINLIGDAGFPAYYVAILFLLISTMILSNQGSKTLELENANPAREL